jgi:hypothetical protein
MTDRCIPIFAGLVVAFACSDPFGTLLNVCADEMAAARATFPGALAASRDSSSEVIDGPSSGTYLRRDPRSRPQV